MKRSRGKAARAALGSSSIRALGKAFASLGATTLVVAGCSGVPGDGSESGTPPAAPSPEEEAPGVPVDLDPGLSAEGHEHFPNSIPADAEVLRAWIPGPKGPALVEYVVVGDWAIADGDIIIGRADELQPIAPGEEDAPPPAMEKGAFRRDGLWPNGVVRYSSSGLAFNFPAAEQTMILNAMQTWTNATGIQFVGVPGRVVTGDYIAFFRGPDCSSAVGRMGGQQAINLAGNCGFRAAVHEIGHAIGLYHEQLRTDRNTFVTVFQQNVQAGLFTQNFVRWVDQGFNGGDTAASAACGIPAYNFDSTMHYRTWDFTSNGWPTMVRIADSNVSGASQRIYKRTSGDWQNINGTGISNANLGYGLFNSGASADLFRSDGAWFFSSGATGSWTSLRTQAEVYRKNRTATQLVLGDFDGNGRTDAVRLSGNAWQVSWNATGAFTTLNADARLNGVVKGMTDVTTGDFDGDEKTDILAASGGNYFVRYGGVGAWQLYIDLPEALPDPWTLGYGDFNGDNITDMFRVNGTTWELLVVNLLLGSAWVAYATGVPAGPLNQALPPGVFSPSIALGDFNGDGLTDVLYTNNLGTTSPGRMQYARTALGFFFDPFVDSHVFMNNVLAPLHFSNFNFNFVHTCKTLSSGPNAGARRCHSGSDVDGDGITDILSTQMAPVERGTKPTLSTGDLFTICQLYAASLTCDSSCPVAVP